jgi:glutaminyl-tRNA synthetase
VTCTGFKKDESGKVVEVYATYDPATKSGLDFTARKVKGTIHWVNAATAVKAQVNLYENLVVPDESSDNGYSLNPDSLKIAQAYLEPSLKDVKPMDRFQFMRNGYFVADSKHCTADNLVFNRIVSLKSSFKPAK